MNPKTATGVAIMGATATGKSAVAIAVARELRGEVISMDSRQVYRGLDIGTAKVLPADQGGIPHHLIDTLDPHEPNTAGHHVAQAWRLMEEIADRGHVSILAGGSGLYFRALFRGLIEAAVPPKEQAAIRAELDEQSLSSLYESLRTVDPERAAVLDPNDRVRIVRSLEVFRWTGRPQSALFAEQAAIVWRGPKAVLSAPREVLRERIAARTRGMFDDGWPAEVKALLHAGCTLSMPGMKSLGYDLIAEAISEARPPEEVIGAVIRVTQQYAKRQETFFRSETDAQWFDVTEPDVANRVVDWVRNHPGLNPT